MGRKGLETKIILKNLYTIMPFRDLSQSQKLPLNGCVMGLAIGRKKKSRRRAGARSLNTLLVVKDKTAS